MYYGTLQKEPTQLELTNRKIANKAASEGFVLLENNGVLPLKEKRIALYGCGARKTVKGGTGSGAVRERYSVSIEQGLCNAGFAITTQSWLDRFDTYFDESYKSYENDVEEKVKGLRNFFQILQAAGKFDYPSGIKVTDEDIKTSAVDTAIYVVARQVGEGHDRKVEKGDYLLDDLEEYNLRKVITEYKNVIVVVNTGAMIDLSFMDQYKPAALIYYVQGGEEGGNALAQLLRGKQNFSGKLAASWPKKYEDIPSSKTFSYYGKDEHNQDYEEGIYVGYRYYDSFHVAPRYHFGYGMSYTTFDIKVQSVSFEEKQDLLCRVNVNVKNTGEYQGKEVIQLYGTVPFGKGAEQQRLLAFQKTKSLVPGEIDNYDLFFSVRDLAIYNEQNSDYELQKGNYILRIGNSSNLTNIIQILEAESITVVEQCQRICPVQQELNEINPPDRENEELSNISIIRIPLEKIKKVNNHYINTAYNADEIENNIKEKIESLSLEQLATLVCGGGTEGKRIVKALGASGSTTAELYEDCGIINIILSDGPAGLNLTSQVVELPDGTVKAAKVLENLEAYKRYLFGFAKIALASRMANPSDGKLYYQYATAWPCSHLLAQSFNTELMQEIGDAIGNEMEMYGVSIYLAPAMNIQRNLLCGRTFEYYSEDPLVSGKMAAAVVKGVQKHKGKGVSIKHFAANNCELERNRSSSNMSEKTLREIYLKGFEIAVKEASPMSVMASYNMINGVYSTNNPDLLIKLLRNEWGFDGLVMSDWDAMKAKKDNIMIADTADILKAHAAQCDLIMPGKPEQVQALIEGVKEGGVQLSDLKRSAARILSIINNSSINQLN